MDFTVTPKTGPPKIRPILAERSAKTSLLAAKIAGSARLIWVPKSVENPCTEFHSLAWPDPFLFVGTGNIFLPPQKRKIAVWPRETI